MTRTGSSGTQRVLFLVTVLASLAIVPTAHAKECPKEVGGACKGHGDCDPPAGGKCTDTLTDCICKVPSSTSHGFFSHFHFGVSGGASTSQGHSDPAQSGQSPVSPNTPPPPASKGN